MRESDETSSEWRKMDPETIERLYVEQTDFYSFTEACVNHIDQLEKGIHRCPEVTAVVVTRKDFSVKADDGLEVVPEGTFLVGEVEFTDRIDELDDKKSQWAMGYCPPDPEAPDGNPLVSGEFFGKDDSVCMAPFILDTNATPEELDVIAKQLAMLTDNDNGGRR